ncbi:unnamed protein product [Adineta steineri]|uniref:Uncharacterized protein n=1 Tax=Adineta steineri TaxID=433720 RepID=A0A814P6B6_9BILA|nr:unnamed protein product [Adineta steineri]
MIVHEFHRVRNRPLSASRKRRQNSSRRSSFNSDPILSERMTFNPESILPGNNIFYSTLDLYSTKDKLESLENEMKLLEDDSTVYTSHLFMLYFNIYLRYGFYFVSFNDNIEDGFNYYNKALEFAEQIEKHEPSGIHKYQLVNAIFQWAKARVRCDRLTDITERKFRRAIELYKQDTLNILCDSLSDKKRLFGDFPEEVIQSKPCIAACPRNATLRRSSF